jgi:hypothetical protein
MPRVGSLIVLQRGRRLDGSNQRQTEPADAPPDVGGRVVTMRTAVADPELDEPCRHTLDQVLAPDESVWAVIRGRSGSFLVGTDRRLVSLPPGCPIDEVEAWPYAELDDLRVVGDGILVRRRRDHHHLLTLPTSGSGSEQTMQAVTIVELLIARHAVSRS